MKTQMNRRNEARPGAAMIMMVLCIVGLFGLLALAIEIGMVAVARSQAQNAADTSAMAGARTITGDSANNYNLATSPTNAVKAATANSILGQVVVGNSASVTSSGTDAYSSGNIALQLGTYGYTYNDSDTSKEKFQLAFPRTDSTEPYSAVRSTVSGQANLFFARVFGVSSSAVQATAVAVHRPRDVIIVMDLSGSMRFQSVPAIPTNGNRTTSMNPDPDYPKFGHYSDTAGAALYGNTSQPTGGGEYFDPSNITYTSNSGPPIAEDFYSNAVGVAPSSGNRAFARGDAGKATAPGGDNYLKITDNTGATYAHTVTGIGIPNTKIANFELKGYGLYSTFKGYTEGPGYWGKTFFVWPPNPGFGSPTSWAAPSSLTDTSYKWYTWADSNPRDWRQRFFVAVNTSSSNSPGVIQHNTILFDSSGNLRLPGTTTAVTENGASVNYTFRINYAAILHWLKQAPVHFPSTIYAGRIRYYTAIPDGADNGLNNRWWTTAPNSLNNNERFWKEYIDFVLGYSASQSAASSYSDISTQVGNGDFYTWSGSTIAVNTRSRIPANPHRNPTTPYQAGVTGPYQVSTTGAYQSKTTTATKAGGSTSVPVNTLTSAPVANTNYVTFGASATGYKITNSSTSSLSLSPALSASVSSGTAANIFSSSNGVGANVVSVNTLANQPYSASDPDNDYVGFNNSTTNLYSIVAPASYTQLTLGTPLAAAQSLSGDSVQIYASSGVAGAGMIQMSVTGLTSAPVANSDYVVFGSDPNNAYLITNAAAMSNGYILTLRTGLVNTVNVNGVAAKIYSPYMSYGDEVKRPKHQFWFGPQTWIDWLGNYNTNKFGWPGNVHEAQAWACKVGIQTAIDDIKKNHPNDYLGMTFFSSPLNSASDTSGFHNRAIVPLGRNYQQLKDSLWFPPSTVTGTATEITPYDTDFKNVPRANGGTAPGMGFMLAYNQLSNSANSLRLYASPSSTYRGNTGGLGRKGAQRLIIFETDGAPNTQAFATFTSQGADSFYPIRVKDPTNYANATNVEWPTSSTYVSSEVYDVVKQICALNTASPPGHSTARRPVLVYPLGYGSLFDAANASTAQTTGLTFLRTVAYHGNTATDTTGANFPDWQRIYGTNQQRIDRMQTAFTNIMQAGTQVSLIE